MPERSLVALLDWGTLGAGPDASSLAAEAATTAGILLAADAAVVAAPSLDPTGASTCIRTLVPALCRALTDGRSALGLRREAVWALWAAVNSDAADSTAADRTLEGIYYHSPGDVATALVDLLRRFDVEAAYGALQLIDAACV